MKIIIGLGNKGSEYQKTRHNIGEYVVQTLVNGLGETLKYDKYTLSNSVKTAEGNTYLIPELYMNESGKIVDGIYKGTKKEETTEYKNILIVRDDVDMKIGDVKLVWDSGSGGHNGLNSINDHLKSKKYWQLKIGILPVDAEGVVQKPAKDDIADFVVGRFSKAEWETMEEIAKKAISKINDFVAGK